MPDIHLSDLLTFVTQSGSQNKHMAMALKITLRDNPDLFGNKKRLMHCISLFVLICHKARIL
jgi:hypothetical protein